MNEKSQKVKSSGSFPKRYSMCASNIQNTSTNLQVKSNHTSKSFYNLTSGTELFAAYKESTSFSKVAFQKKVQLKSYFNLLEFRDENRLKVSAIAPKRKESDIFKFSKHSRLRLMKLFSKINLNCYNEIKHITLTYRNNFPKELIKVKEQFKYFLYLLNEHSIEFNYVARIEFQKRGAPHIHLIALFPSKYTFKSDELFRAFLANIWCHVIKDQSLSTNFYSVQVSSGHSYKKLYSYVSKYACKIEEENTKDYKGRRWCCSRELKVKPLEEIELSKFRFDEFLERLLKFLKENNRLNYEFERALNESVSCFIFITQEELYKLFYPS